MIAKVSSVALVGMEGYPIEVEVSVAPGLPVFTIVGLPDPSIQEARERVRAAITSAGETWPGTRITINLSPAHLRKTGSSYDLAMALGILIAGGRIAPERLDGVCVLGELSLDGSLRRVRGVLPSAIAAADAGMKRMIVPASNAREAGLVSGVDVYPLDHLSRAVRFLRAETDIDPWFGDDELDAVTDDDLDFTDVRGNAIAKRALEIAAAGGHNLLMLGAPGGGKTMLARRVPTVLPPMTEAESFEVTRIYSVAGLLDDDAALVTRRPFRAPHHTGSTTGMVGGGSGTPHVGEASLAHRGVLFLDEYGEFRTETLQALRQPLEDGCVRIVRSRWAVTFPARFQMVAASNPCPCGFAGDTIRVCVCAPGRFAHYQEKLTGPIIDRIDMQVGVVRLSKRQLFGAQEGDPSSLVRARVAVARTVQRDRSGDAGVICNAELPPRDLAAVCRLTREARAEVESAMERIGLSARGAHRVARVARTIADLAGAEHVDRDEVLEALSYRVLDARAEQV